MKTVLIIGQTPDPHIASVMSHLRDLNAEVIFFDICQPEECTISLRFSRSSSREGVLETKLGSFKMSEIDTVWWRFKPVVLHHKDEERVIFWSEFTLREWKSVLESLDSFLLNASWVNPRSSDLRAGHKATQLMIAEDVGFKIPNTLISNNSRQIVKFVKQNEDDTIYKTLTWYTEGQNEALFTSKVTYNQILKNSGYIGIAPGIFQERVPKAYEVRVTTIGKKIFSASIESQVLKETMLDWRRNQLGCHTTYINCPKP